MGPRLRGDDGFELIAVDDAHRIFGRIAVHPGVGFAPCWGELLFQGQKVAKSPAPAMAPNSLRESGTRRARPKTGAAQLASLREAQTGARPDPFLACARRRHKSR